MAKKVGFSGRIKTGKGKDYTKVIKAIKSPKTGAYIFKEDIIHKDLINDFFGIKQATTAEPPTGSG
ncbi:MAG: DUF4295 domain-containing protein [Bacteroidota bacterium]